VISGTGNLVVALGGNVACPDPLCSISILMNGGITIAAVGVVQGGRIVLQASGSLD